MRVFDPTVAAGVRCLTLDQFGAVWKRARAEQGVQEGDAAVPAKSHPDIAKDFSKLPPDRQCWITGLVCLARVEVLARLPLDARRQFLMLGRAEVTADPAFIDMIAELFHAGWWAWRTMNNMTGHVGDKPWADENDAERANDRALVPKMATLLASYLESDIPGCRELAEYVFGDALAG